MPRAPERNLSIGAGGVAAELGVSDPRRAKPEVARRLPKEPPPEDEMTENEWARMLEPRLRPGQKSASKSGRVRWCHRVIVDGKVAICHAFTVSRETHEAVRMGEALRAKDTMRPDGLPVVREGKNPIDVAVRCASCGTEQVGCREMVFFWD